MTQQFHCGQDVEVKIDFTGKLQPTVGSVEAWRKAKISGSIIDPLIYQVTFPGGRKALVIPKRIRAVTP
jgi:hypothetical protein